MIGDWTHKFLFNIQDAIGDLKMVTAIVLMNADRMQIKDVAQKLVDMHQVTEVFSVAGRYDLIAMVRVKSTEEVADTITEKIGALQGITATETLIAFQTYSRHDLEHMFSIGE